MFFRLDSYEPNYCLQREFIPAASVWVVNEWSAEMTCNDPNLVTGTASTHFLVALLYKCCVCVCGMHILWLYFRTVKTLAIRQDV